MTRFFVPGLPQPQGSTKGFCDRSQQHRVVITTDNNRLKPWRNTIALTARHLFPLPAAGPVEVALVFYLPAPARMPKGRVAPTVRPDLDKLGRAVLDALTAAGAYIDDSQVVALSARKRYGRPGVLIEVLTPETPLPEAS